MNLSPENANRLNLFSLFFSIVVLTLVLSPGCATVDNTADPLALLAEGENVIGSAAHTLADAADAGVISRDSDDYNKAAVAILDAGEKLDKGWELYAAGDITGALASRANAIALYLQLVRPTLIKYSLEAE